MGGRRGEQEARNKNRANLAFLATLGTRSLQLLGLDVFREMVDRFR